MRQDYTNRKWVFFLLLEPRKYCNPRIGPCLNGGDLSFIKVKRHIWCEDCRFRPRDHSPVRLTDFKVIDRENRDGGGTSGSHAERSGGDGPKPGEGPYPENAGNAVVCCRGCSRAPLRAFYLVVFNRHRVACSAAVQTVAAGARTP